jgi:uncharacterized protein
VTTPARQKTDLTVFWTVTFTTTWAFWLTAIAMGGSPTSSPTVLPYLLGGFGPVFGAIVVRIRRGHHPAPAHTVRTRFTPRLLRALPLLALASASVAGAAFLSDLLGGPAVDLTGGRDLIASIGGVAPFIISMIIAGPLAEEPGWRGTAYPRLRDSLGRVEAGLLLGVAWAVWHLPLFFITGTVQSELGLFSPSGLMFTLTVLPMALLTGYAYERAGVVAAIAVHFGVNATTALLTVKSPITQAAVLALQVLVAAALLSLRRAPRRAPVPRA